MIKRAIKFLTAAFLFTGIFLFSYGSVYSAKTLVTTGQEPMDCPTGFTLAEGYCCQNGSSVADKTIGYTPYKTCWFAGDEPAYGVPKGKYCPSGSVALGFKYSGSLDAAKDWCVSRSTLVRDDEWGASIFNKYFVGCLSPVVISGTGVRRGTDVEATYSYSSCDITGAKFVSSIASCVCKDGSEHEVDNADECTNICASKGGVLSSGGVGAAQSNSPVYCEIGGNPNAGILTALGCIPVSTDGIVNWVVKFAIVVAGGLVVFRIIQGSVVLMTSTGNPEKVQEGKEIISSAVIGVIVIIASVVLLEFIGVNVLGLDNLGFSFNS